MAIYDISGNEIYSDSDNTVICEPADDDLPMIFITGTLPASKAAGDVQVKLRYVSKTADFEYPSTLAVQGDTSANYAKKNFTLKMYTDSNYATKVKYEFKNWGKLNKFVLKAHWIDHSHIRNVGTAKMWGKIVRSRSDFDSLPDELKNAPNNGATDGFTCKVFANGVYQGLYELIVPKSKLFGQDSDNYNHSILNSEWNDQASCAFSTTSPTISGNWKEEFQDILDNDISTSFSNFVAFVAGSSDADFVSQAETYFDVQSVIDFDIFARIFCIVDNLCKNQIFFTYNGTKWYEGAWDLDGVLGLPPVSGNFFTYDTEFQEGYLAYSDFNTINLLYQRIEECYKTRFKARYTSLRNTVLSEGEIISVYEKLANVIDTFDGLLEEDYASTTGAGAFTGIPYKEENTIQQLRNFVANRLTYMDGIVSAM